MPRLKFQSSLREYLDQVPPKLTRLLARDMKKKRQPLTNLQIATASGLHPKRVAQISLMNTWGKLTVDEIDAFRSACGITMKNLCRHRAYIAQTLRGQKPMSHLNNRRAKTKFLKELLNKAQ